MKRPKKGEYAPFHENYLSKLPARGSLTGLLKKTFKELQAQLLKMPEEMGDYRYAEGKWSIKEMLIHMIDTERVFAFRALWFMRGDKAPQPGFNQDFWMERADVSQRSIKDLLKEWKAVRDNTLFLASQCTEEQSKMMGTASNWQVSVRTMFWVIVGHQLHHEDVLVRLYKTNKSEISS
jgi:uncharacterized damage-inducible protein DinB